MKLAACLGVVVLAWCLALPAAGAQPLEARMEGVSEGATVKRSVSLRASASYEAGVERLQIFIGDDLVAERRAEGFSPGLDLSYSWDTRRAVGSGLPAPNGAYRVRAVAFGRGNVQDEDVVNVLVGNPPARPAGLKVSVSGPRVSLSWSPGSEPDLVGYRVQRSGGRRWRAIAETTEPDYAERPGRGVFRYRVLAVRTGARPSERLLSAPSAPVRASIASPGARGSRGAGGGRIGRGLGTSAATSRFGRSGLPPEVRAPGARLPASRPAPEQEWGTYDEALPYDLSARANRKPVALSGERAVLGVIPADGLRWVAAGLLLIVCAALLRLFALRSSS